MKVHNLKCIATIAAGVGAGLFFLFFIVTSVWIGYEAKQLCTDARAQYGGDCTNALGALVDDEHRGYRDRNHAIWALGQWGDAQALPILEKYYTGNIPEREPLDSVISQYELKKAIALTRGGFNMTAFLWR